MRILAPAFLLLCLAPAAWASSKHLAPLSPTAASPALSQTASAASLTGAAHAFHHGKRQAEPSHDPAKVAAALGASEAAVREAYAVDLAERLTYTLARLSARCACPPSQLMEERKTRSWGEVAGLHGVAWGDLMEEIEGRIAAAGLDFSPPSPEQELRSGANDPSTLPDHEERP